MVLALSSVSAAPSSDLERTLEGKQWIAHLYAHVFVEEHLRARPGPERENGRQATAEA